MKTYPDPPSENNQVVAHEAGDDFRKVPPMVSAEIVADWLKEQVPLGQCVLVALSVHVILLPLMWLMGWALPWPKPPVITTVVEYDLRNWPRVAKPKKVLEVIDPDLNK